MSGLSTLAEALDRRLRQAAMVGWRVGRRKQIEIAAGHATLTLSWRDDTGLRPAEKSRHIIGGSVVSFDPSTLPPGVAALEWSALPDTRDLVVTPSMDEVRATARKLGCTEVETGVGNGLTIYWLRGDIKEGRK